MYNPYGFQNAAAGGGAGTPQGLGGGPNMGYNPQQFAMMGGGSGTPNPGVPQMAANGQMPYQTPYTTSPYGPNVSSPAPPQAQLPQNYMISGSTPPHYAMNQSHMPAQNPAMMQRGAISPQQRQPFHPTAPPPNSMAPQQVQQHATSQGNLKSRAPANSQPPANMVTTPQTPTFPSAGSQTNETAAAHAPLSPGAELRGKERFTLMLEINQELLYESMQLQYLRTELEKEKEQNAQAGAETGDGQTELNRVVQDYTQCMRRLQGNLAYLATLADRKVSANVPAAPAYLSPPFLNLTIKMRAAPDAAADSLPEKPSDPNADRELRDRYLKELYKKLQGLFPGLDPKKDPQQMSGAARLRQPGGGQLLGKQPGQGGSNHGSPMTGPHRTPQMANTLMPA